MFRVTFKVDGKKKSWKVPAENTTTKAGDKKTGLAEQLVRIETMGGTDLKVEAIS